MSVRIQLIVLGPIHDASRHHGNRPNIRGFAIRLPRSHGQAGSAGRIHSRRWIEVLSPLVGERAKAFLRSDNGPEFVLKVLLFWTVT